MKEVLRSCRERRSRRTREEALKGDERGVSEKGHQGRLRGVAPEVSQLHLGLWALSVCASGTDPK